MNRYYDTALAEIEGGHPKPSLWARALAECFDDAAKARPRYIKLRVEEMRREARTAREVQRLEEEARQTAKIASADPSFKRVIAILLVVFAVFAAATMINSVFRR